MSLGATITGRKHEYSPSRKPIVPSIERGEEPIKFDENPKRLSDESQDDRTDRHAFAKSRPSSANTCTSDTDENDYETSSEGPSRLNEVKTCHTHLLSKSHSGNLSKEEEAVEGKPKVSEGFETEEKMDFRQYAYVRKDVSDIAMSTVSLPILRSIESSPTTTEVKDRMISDSSFARQQKLRMIVEQTELLLSPESKIAESVKPEVCYLGKKYELNKRESLMLLPVIQNIELTEKDQINESIPKMTENIQNPLDPVVYCYKSQDHSNDLIDIVENPESSKTSLYIPPNPLNDLQLENKSSNLFNNKRRFINDTNVRLKIHRELSPLRCELNETAAKYRALKLQRISNTMDENKITVGYSIGDRIDIDRGIVGNTMEQFPPMTMVGKSTSQVESSCFYSTDTSKLFNETGLHVDRSIINETKKNHHPVYFGITPVKKNEYYSSIGNKYLGERISNYYPHNQTCSQFERFYYRPGSSCIRDRCQREKGIVRSTNDEKEEKGSFYDTDFISRKSNDMNGSQYISRANADEPSDILILGRSKEVVKEDDHTTTNRQRSKKDLRDSTSMSSSAIVTKNPNLIDENILSGDKDSFSNVTLCKKSQDFPLDLRIPYSKMEKSISRIENVQLLNENTSKDFLIVKDSKLFLNKQQQRQKLQEKILMVHQYSQTSNLRMNESLTSTRRSKVIGIPKSMDKVKIVPIFFTRGIPKPLFPIFQLDDTEFSLNSTEKLARQHVLMLKKRNSHMIFNCLSEKRHPSESDVSGSYVTGPPTLKRDYLLENERWRSNNVSKISSCISPSCSSKKTTSSNASKYTNALGNICSGVARVTVSGSTISNRQKRFTQIREITTEKGIRGMRSSPEDFLSDT